jgi:hypothetical protein
MRDRTEPGTHRRIPKVVGAIVLMASLIVTSLPAFADDGAKVLKRISPRESDAAADHPAEAEHVFTNMLKFYVPMQRASGEVFSGDAVPEQGVLDENGDDPAPFEYRNVDGTVVDTRYLAKPLVDVMMYGPFEDFEGIGFIGHGKRDAYAAVSLDDGQTWKQTNLSESADDSSSDVLREDLPIFADTDGYYPGDVINVVHAVAGNKVLVAWPSRYCASGQPNYSLDNPDEQGETPRRDAVADYLGLDLTTPAAENLYLLDMYKVAGQQQSIDYASYRWPQVRQVGEVPFACLWTARGELVNGDDPRTAADEASFMRWYKPERLTSGRRDVNRVEVAGVAGAGFAITWQEDPDGLRTGQGLGPGEGWSGAIANSGTDLWYSYIDWEHFNVVQDPQQEGTENDGLLPLPLSAADFTAAEGTYEAVAAATPDVTQKPKPFVPFAMPMRLTDNAKCNLDNPAPYCYGEATPDEVAVPTDDAGVVLDPRLYGLRDMCAATTTVPTGRYDTPKEVCVSEDGLPLLGNKAATRARFNLFGYDSSGAVEDAVIDSAFLVLQVEDNKGLGRALYVPDEYGRATETPCPEDADHRACVPFDEGKNQRYYSFSMSLTDRPLSHPQDDLLYNLGFHGNMLNQPEVDWTTGEFFAPRNTADMLGWTDTTYGHDLYNTEVARRGSLLAQDIGKVHKDVSEADGRLLVLATYKQGQMEQGGPADIMSRRILIPETTVQVTVPGKGKQPPQTITQVKGWDLVRDGNPYAFRNMECEQWDFADGSNPHYPEGVCLDPAINVSSTIPDTAFDTDTQTTIDPPTVDFTQSTTFGIGDTDPILQGGHRQGEGDTTKVLTWHQCPADYNVVAGEAQEECTADERPDPEVGTLRDQSWYNPLSVAKGHRGFLDGDFVMMMYGASPNWRLNTKGSDRYDLYIRRSFDGAGTWTTLPGDYEHHDGSEHAGDGTVTCERFRSEEKNQQGERLEPKVCNAYAAGAAEQARNVTQHEAMKITTLDPRFAPTMGGAGDPDLNGPHITALFGIAPPNYTAGTAVRGEDVRDPSRYFIVFEEGDNTTTEFGEPDSIGLSYSRGVAFGDHYQVWAEEDDLSVCYPSDPHGYEVPEEYEGSGFCNEFDKMETGRGSVEPGESSVIGNPGGQFLYGAWARVEYGEHEEVADAAAMARRMWWIDGYVSETWGWNLGQGPNN